MLPRGRVISNLTSLRRLVLPLKVVRGGTIGFRAFVAHDVGYPGKRNGSLVRVAHRILCPRVWIYFPFATPSLYTVVCVYLSPGLRVMLGKSFWFGESGKNWSSRQNA